MRCLPFLLACACLLAAPGAAAQEVPVTWHDEVEETVDELLDMTALLDAHLGDMGRCVRQGAVSEVKTLYGDEDDQGRALSTLTMESQATSDGDGNPVVDCIAAQCVGWPPRPFVSTTNCRQMVEDIIDQILSIYAVESPDISLSEP